MREAIGATWITGVVLVFIALFSGYLALSINYSKAFKVKDGIVDRLEKHSGPNKESIEDIAEMLEAVGYNSKGSCDRLFNDIEDTKRSSKFVGVNKNHVSKNPTNGRYNYCVLRINSNMTNGAIVDDKKGQLSAAYYRVIVFFSLSLPIIENFSNFNVTGETININYPEDDYMG
jgi:hypothetical protein